MSEQTFETARGECAYHTEADFQISCRAIDGDRYAPLSIMLKSERLEEMEGKDIARLGFAATVKNMINNAHTAKYGMHALHIKAVY